MTSKSLCAVILLAACAAPSAPSGGTDPADGDRIALRDASELAKIVRPGDDEAVRNEGITYEGQDERWARYADAVRAAPGVVRRGYAQHVFPYNEQLWQEVLVCRNPGPLGEAALDRFCFVCSIDDVGGQRFPEGVMPPTGVSIRAAYARYRRDARGQWALDQYEPFAGNRFARNGELRHQASLRWIKELAVGECYEMQQTSGYLNIY